MVDTSSPKKVKVARTALRTPSGACQIYVWHYSVGVRRYQKGKTNLDLTEARDSEWQWHQLGHMHASLHLAPDR